MNPFEIQVKLRLLDLPEVQARLTEFQKELGSIEAKYVALQAERARLVQKLKNLEANNVGCVIAESVQKAERERIIKALTGNPTPGSPVCDVEFRRTLFAPFVTFTAKFDEQSLRTFLETQK